ncbi:MAG: hypothetical protein ACR2HH_06630 [Chthoniobacterales bacterium]
MNRKIIAVGIVALASSATIYASGNQAPASSTSRNGIERTEFTGARSGSASHIVVVQEPYNLGQALFSGKYNLGKPKLTEANIAEKQVRLASLQRLMPASGQKQLHPEMGSRLTNQEANALEYFVAVRFSKILNKPPSWAKQNPPVKIAFSN